MMRAGKQLLCVAIILAFSGCQGRPEIKAYFRPGDDIRGMIINETGRAKKSVHVMAYRDAKTTQEYMENFQKHIRHSAVTAG